MATTAARLHSEEKLPTIHPIKFESFEDDGCFSGHGAEDWLKTELESLDAVHVEITRSGDEIRVRAEVPGFAEKEVEVTVEPRRLTIAGKRGSNTEEKEGNAVNQVFCSKQIFRVVDLPLAVDADKVTTTLKNGVLQMTMPEAA